MKFNELYLVLEKNKYYVFALKDILTFYPNENLINLKKLVYRWKKRGLIKILKKGLYELVFPKDYNIPDMYIANKLYFPSYL